MIDWDLVLRIGLPLFTLFAGAALNKLIEDRPKLVTFFNHAGVHTLKDPAGVQPPIQLHVHSVVVRNNGRKAAANVRLGHSALPQFDIFPSVAHHVETLPSGGSDIVIPTLVPKEQVIVSYVYYPPLLYSQINTTVKSDAGFAKVLDVLPTPQPPRWLARTLWTLTLFGATAVGYVLYTIIRFIAARA